VGSNNDKDIKSLPALFSFPNPYIQSSIYNNISNVEELSLSSPFALSTYSSSFMSPSKVGSVEKQNHSESDPICFPGPVVSRKEFFIPPIT
jgi:hypothetical protein